MKTIGRLRVWRGRRSRGVLLLLAAGALGAGSLAAVAALDGRLPLPGARHVELAEPVRPVAPGLIRLDGDDGRRLLFDSEAHAAFLPLTSHFETQLSLTHCGTASIVMVLNALEAPAPAVKDYAPYRLFTQRNLLNGRTRSITSHESIARRGMTLEQVGAVLRAYDVDAEARQAGASTPEEFRDLAAAHLDTAGRHVIVNYSRAALGQDGAGHISPLGAYDAESDRFLILDVSRYKAPSVWVETERLFAAMAEPVGGDPSRTRGFVLIDGRDGSGANQPSSQ
jgi:hypothetical protein